ncbi:hypothetical protein DFJ73DRAFT_860315 [Zopfochytrium polystomum]|nr:hypothetical protein DFJ73DRAFT_860315 [Zopfochytrium polystomum]
MGKSKKRKQEMKPWCWYCNREFEDIKVLMDHQKAKHFKCKTCNKRLSTAGGLQVHCQQVHKETINKIENALPGRESCEIEIFGMEGIPEQDMQAHIDELEGKSGVNKRAHTAQLSSDSLKEQLAAFQAQKEAFAAGNGMVLPPFPGMPPAVPGAFPQLPMPGLPGMPPSVFPSVPALPMPGAPPSMLGLPGSLAGAIPGMPMPPLPGTVPPLAGVVPPMPPGLMGLPPPPVPGAGMPPFPGMPPSGIPPPTGIPGMPVMPPGFRPFPPIPMPPGSAVPSVPVGLGVPPPRPPPPGMGTANTGSAHSSPTANASSSNSASNRPPIVHPLPPKPGTVPAPQTTVPGVGANTSAADVAAVGLQSTFSSMSTTAEGQDAQFAGTTSASEVREAPGGNGVDASTMEGVVSYGKMIGTSYLVFADNEESMEEKRAKHPKHRFVEV